LKRLVLVGCIAAATGCSGAHTATNGSSLALPIAVSTGTVAQSDVTFTIEGGFASATQVALTMHEPIVKLHTAAGRATLDAISLPLGDVNVSAEALPPKGLILKNLVVSAPATHAEIMHDQADALEVRAMIPLALDWSVVLDDGSLYPLGTVHTEPLNVDITVSRVGGSTTATVQAACLGTCWAVDGVAKLSNGTVYLEAGAEVTAAE
jgi:hypothetical protein